MKKQHSSFLLSSRPNPYSEMELSIAQERLRQASLGFNLAFVAKAISACVGLVGAGLLLSGKVPEGTVTATVGLVSGIRYVQLAKDANDRLDKVLMILQDEDRT